MSYVAKKAKKPAKQCSGRLLDSGAGGPGFESSNFIFIFCLLFRLWIVLFSVLFFDLDRSFSSKTRDLCE